MDQVIKPALAKGEWVLCDRFSASSVAFQSGGRAISADQVHALNHFATDGLEADLTVLLDLPVEESRRRRQQRSFETGESEDRMESEKDLFHENVRQSFLKQAREKSAAWLILDARRTQAELAQDLLSALTKRNFLKA